MSFRREPIPEILDGKAWTIKDSRDPRKSHVDKRNRKMWVPLDDSPESSFTRNHCLGHVKITPNRVSVPADIPVESIQAAEDARVNSALRVAGIDTDVSVWTNPEVDTFMFKDELDQARYLLSVKGTQDYNRLLKVSKDPAKMDKFVNEAFARLQKSEERGKVASFDETIWSAKRLEECFEAEEVEQEEQPSDGEPDENAESVPGSGSAQGTPSNEDPQEEEEESDSSGNEEEEEDSSDSQDPQPEQNLSQTELSSNFSPESSETTPSNLANDFLSHQEQQEAMEYVSHGSWAGNATFGSLNVEEPRLDKPMKKSIRKRVTAKRATAYGGIPRYMSRWAADGSVFAERGKKAKPVTILLDVSGSMSLSEEQVDKIVDLCPRAKVAIYSGYGYTGTLRVIADGGRRLSRPKENMAGYNIVDLPALEWLAKQKGAKYWISDGIVTGKGGQMVNADSIRKLVRLCKEARIYRVDNIKEAMNAMFINLDRHEKKATAYEAGATTFRR